ncbi:MAG: NYN domain-containing protein [Krumholzibacteria bacterium]|nr:NYN domain-containing protein [Candidatus Krumholzibacteria bacterium]
MVDVIKTEGKRSDVNLAAHLLRDGFTGDFDVAVVVSNDSNLLEPIRIVQAELGRSVGWGNPQKHPSRVLKNEARFSKSIRRSAIAKCQFPAVLTDAGGTIRKPSNG